MTSLKGFNKYVKRNYRLPNGTYMSYSEDFLGVKNQLIVCVVTEFVWFLIKPGIVD